ARGDVMHTFTKYQQHPTKGTWRAWCACGEATPWAALRRDARDLLAEHTHELVASGLVRISDAGAHRNFAVCGCGKRYTGWGDTPFQTHARHAAKEAAA